MVTSSLYEAISGLNTTSESYKEDFKFLVDAYDEEWRSKGAALREELVRLSKEVNMEYGLKCQAIKRADRATRSTERMIKILNRFMKENE